MKSYLTPGLVKLYSSYAAKVDLCSTQTVQQTEDYIWLTTLKSLKPLLDKERIDYSSAKVFDYDKTYEKGEFCIYKDKNLIKVAKSQTKGNRPDNIDFWEEAPMFKKECYNDMWCRFIAPYISHMVVWKDAPMIRQLALSGMAEATYLSRHLIDAMYEQITSIANQSYQSLVLATQENECFGFKPTYKCGTCIKEKTQIINNPIGEIFDTGYKIG